MDDMPCRWCGSPVVAHPVISGAWVHSDGWTACAVWPHSAEPANHEVRGGE